MSADPTAVMDRLDKLATELDQRSNRLAAGERSLSGYDQNGEHVAGVEELYEQWMDTYITGLWAKHIEDGAKLPSEEIRLRLARKDMPPKLLGEYTDLKAQRKRLENRIRDIKTQVEAQRSILSALKTEAEASGAGLRRAA